MTRLMRRCWAAGIQFMFPFPHKTIRIVPIGRTVLILAGIVSTVRCVDMVAAV